MDEIVFGTVELVAEALAGESRPKASDEEARWGARLAGIGEEMGLEYGARGSLRLEGMDPFTGFTGTAAKEPIHVLQGALQGRKICILEHRASGVLSVVRTVAILQLEGAVPTFQLRPECFKDKVLALVGFNDIDFDAFPEFSRRYCLTGSDGAALRGLFQPDVLAWFEQHLDWAVEALGNTVVLCRTSSVTGFRRLEPAEIKAFAEEAVEVVGLIRGHLASLVSSESGESTRA